MRAVGWVGARGVLSRRPQLKRVLGVNGGAGERVTKQDFMHRLQEAGALARTLAEGYVIESLPEELRYTLPRFDDPRGARGPVGTIKFFGGRFLRSEQLRRLTASRAGDLLWVDGKCPAWVNLSVCCCDSTVTEIRVRVSRDLMIADPRLLPRDVGTSPDNDLAPFRLRGPGVPEGWRSVEQDGRVSLLKRAHDHGDA
jgi:hypothetical protein